MRFHPTKHGQIFFGLIKAYKRIMSFSLSARKLVACWCSMVAIPVAVFSQNSFVPVGGESALSGALPGDQVHPAVNFTTNGGFVVWEDNWIDGKGLGIGAMRLQNDLTGTGVPFRVDSVTTGDQEAGQVSVLNDGGAAFAWQSGPRGRQHIFVRFLSSSNNWETGDVMVNSATNKFQTTPVIATLLNGNVALVYVSVNQAGNGSMADVYLQMFAPDGSRIGGETLVNQFTANNQRTPAIAPLADGKLAIAWVSEQQRWTDASNGVPSVDVFARIFDSAGNALGNEFLVNLASTVCAAPDVAPSPDGGFLATWMEKDLAVKNNGWDISARRFSSGWVGGNETRVNTQLYGDQYAPKIRRAGSTYLDVWTSIGQDGSREGVFARYLNDDASTSGQDFQVNSTTYGSQMHQALGTDGAGRFLTVWTSFNPGPAGFDINSQRYIDPTVAVLGTNNPAFNTDPNANTNSVDAVAVGAAVLPPAPVAPILTSDRGVTDSIVDVKGTYNGLVADPNNVTGETSGYITITITTKGLQGSFSAKLQLGGQKYSFSGSIDSTGAFTVAKPVSGLQINLAVDLQGGDQITGMISTGSASLTVQANRSVYSKSHPTPFVGNYTMVMQPIDSSMGNGVGTVAVDKLGNVKWTLTLADGTKFGQSTTLAKDGSWPLYSEPYKTGGVAIGRMIFNGSPTNGFNGQCVWIKPGGSPVYPGGLTNSLNVIGSPFKAPPKAFQAFGGSRIVLSGGGLSSPMTNTVTWAPNNKVSASPSVKLSVNTKSGLFEGTVAVAPGKGGTVPIHGVLFEKDNVGLGFFLGAGQSGTVTFGPNN
jgi:hypothetical protein